MVFYPAVGKERYWLLQPITKIESTLHYGRMDMHIYLTYCTFSAFKQLALKYLEISDHSLFHHVKKLLPKVKVSPAEVAAELMKTRDPKASIEGLIKHLEEKVNVCMYVCIGKLVVSHGLSPF